MDETIDLTLVYEELYNIYKSPRTVYLEILEQTQSGSRYVNKLFNETVYSTSECNEELNVKHLFYCTRCSLSCSVDDL